LEIYFSFTFSKQVLTLLERILDKGNNNFVFHKIKKQLCLNIKTICPIHLQVYINCNYETTCLISCRCPSCCQNSFHLLKTGEHWAFGRCHVVFGTAPLGPLSSAVCWASLDLIYSRSSHECSMTLGSRKFGCPRECLLGDLSCAWYTVVLNWIVCVKVASTWVQGLEVSKQNIRS